MKSRLFDNVIWKEGNHFVAQCLNVDISSFGDSKEEALKQLKEALELYYEDENISDFTMIEQPEIVHTEING